jgi:hypothetical protein
MDGGDLLFTKLILDPPHKGFLLFSPAGKGTLIDLGIPFIDCLIDEFGEDILLGLLIPLIDNQIFQRALKALPSLDGDQAEVINEGWGQICPHKPRSLE